MKTVPLYGSVANGRVALVDDADYELVMEYRWRVREQALPGRRRVNGPYAVARVYLGNRRQTTIVMHKLITGWPETDHINHNGLDNRRANLRPGDEGRNRYNQRPWSGHSSRFKGVTWNSRSGKWQARIQVNKKSRSLGFYVEEEDAALAYDVAARVAFGDYAYLNFPNRAA